MIVKSSIFLETRSLETIFVHLSMSEAISSPDAQGAKNNFGILNKCNLDFCNLELISYVYADKPLISTYGCTNKIVYTRHL